MARRAAIGIDLEPLDSQYGQLRSRERNDAYLALSRRKSPYHFEITTAAEIHGTMDDSSTKRPGSLLVFHVRALPDNSKSRPIRHMTIEMTFGQSDAPSEPGRPPAIIKFAPGEPPTVLQCTQETQSETVSGGVNAAANPPMATLGVEMNAERSKSRVKSYSASVRGYKRPSDDLRSWNTANHVKWTIEENDNQGNGVPPDFALAALLERSEGPFVCHVRIHITVRQLPSIQEWWEQFSKWGKKAPEPWLFDPSSIPKGIATDFPTLLGKIGRGDSLSTLNISNDCLRRLCAPRALEPFVYIHVPEVYSEYTSKVAS